MLVRRSREGRMLLGGSSRGADCPCAASRNRRVSQPACALASTRASVCLPVLRRRDRVRSPHEGSAMDVLVECAAGLDVHQASIVACVLVGRPGEKPRKEIRRFGTMTADLEALRDWLAEWRVSHVGMESTGVCWKPVHTILEGHFALIVANAHHIKAVPGRKTDVNDAAWIADLIRHGLVKPSFVPPPAIRELRDLLRHRRTLAETVADERNRTLKLLETANIKLSSVATRVWPRMCSASPAPPCSRLSPRATWRPKPWPIWPRAACAPSASRWPRRSRGVSPSTTASCCACTCAGSRSSSAIVPSWRLGSPTG